MYKFEVVEGKVKGFDQVTFSQEVEGCKFPGYLKDISSRWYGVEYKGKYIGNIYEHQGHWRAFSSSVENLDGKPESCIKWLIFNIVVIIGNY